MIRDQILQFDDLPRGEVAVPEWGGVTVTVRTLCGRELWDFQRRFAGKPVDISEVITGIVVAACCDGEGKPIFSATDAEALQAKNPAALSRVANRAFELNPALTADGVSRAEKN